MKSFFVALLGAFCCIHIGLAQSVTGDSYLDNCQDSKQHNSTTINETTTPKTKNNPPQQNVDIQEKAVSLPINELAGYYFSPTTDLAQKTFYVIESLNDFEQLFKPAPVMFSQLATPVDFSRYCVLVIAVEGNFYPQFSSISLQKKQNTLNFAYQYKVVSENLDWSSSVAHAVVVEKGGFSSVEFSENDKPIHKTNLVTPQN